MTDAGYAKDRSGFFANAAGERFRPNVQSDGAAQFEREMNLIQDIWGRIGIEIQPYMLPAVQVRNNEPRNTFPDLYITSTGARESALNIFAANEIGTAANRWAGNNRGGWSNADFGRWWGAFNTTLDRSERNQQVVELSKVVSDQVPSMPLYFNISPIGHVAALRGPDMGTPESLAFWNLHEWELR